jgi:hypothetical protein
MEPECSTVTKHGTFLRLLSSIREVLRAETLEGGRD